MKLQCDTINEFPDDATIVSVEDPDARDFWVGWFDASVEDIEAAMKTVGSDLEHVEAYLAGHIH